ncbi:MAG: GGDEF domain-containing protein [Desulfobacteraceae bacterium]|nr:GGDEF domain-containing protein [Desulfobacteraceae bacterium]
MDVLPLFGRIRIKIFDVIEQQSRITRFALSLGLTALLGVIDYSTGDYSFTIFYLIPIFFAAWFVGNTAGLAVCISSFISSIVTNPDRFMIRNYSVLSKYYWDISLEFFYFILMSLMFSSLKAQFNAERELSRIDHLTNALNRRALCEVLDYEIARNTRHGSPMSIAFIDLDNFKTVNDKMGHAEGDKVLCEVVAAMRGTLRKADTIARVGGDEFVVLLPETGEESAAVVIRKVRDTMLASMARNGWPVTFSIGLVTHEATPESAEEMINQADLLMYSIKGSNKNDILQRVKRNEPITTKHLS